MDGSNVVKLVHIAIAFAFVAGLLGRWILLHRASKAEDPETAFALAPS